MKLWARAKKENYPKIIMLIWLNYEPIGASIFRQLVEYKSHCILINLWVIIDGLIIFIYGDNCPYFKYIDWPAYKFCQPLQELQFV